MSYIITRFFFLLLLSLGAQNDRLGLVAGCHEVEREALFKFKESLVHLGDHLSSWKGTDCCRWEGVGCDNVTANVNRLDLHNPHCHPYSSNTSYFLVSPKLEHSLVELKYLNYLDLSCNDFQGSQIPGFVFSFNFLRHLNLSNSNFNGVVPSRNPVSIGTLSNLEELDISQNNLTGTLPNWLGDMGKLRLFYARSNSISGQIPKSIGNLSLLERLDLSNNTLNGTIPLGLGQCRSLVSIDLSSNLLQGVVSESHLANLTRLDYLSLNYNPLEFNLSPNWSLKAKTSSSRNKKSTIRTITRKHHYSILS